MQIQKIIDDLVAPAGGMLEKTVDTVKAGDASRCVRHIGTCFMATAEVVRKAQALGVEFLITHEPTYYDHFDRLDRPGQPLVAKKKALVEESGLTIWRFHDHIHRYSFDGIVEGIVDALGWKGHMDGECWMLDTPMTAREMAADIRAKLDCGGVRASGMLDTPFDRVLMAVGAPGLDNQMMDRLLATGLPGVIFVGEVSEWGALEQVRDAAAFGMPLAALTCGHAVSEEQGMRLLAEKLRAAYPELTVDFIPTGEVYEHL